MVHGQGVELTHLVVVPSTREKYMCVDWKRVREHICSALRAALNCLIHRMNSDKEFEMPEKPTIGLVVAGETLP